MGTDLELGGEAVSLFAQKALLLVQDRTLLVADVHIGKAASFRRLGVPVPSGTTAETLARLSALIEKVDARQLVFLGDLLHSAAARSPATLTALAAWRLRHAGLAMTLVRGNHDAHAGDPPHTLDIEAIDEPLRLRGLALCHHPRPQPGTYVLAGHLHPCIHVGGAPRDRLRLPCFHFGPEVGVLPAFGAFTGMAPIERQPLDRVYVVGDDRVLPLAPQRAAPARR